MFYYYLYYANIVKRRKKPGPIIGLIVNALSIFIVSYLLSGIYVDSIWTALIVALILSILNVTLKPLLILLTIPITILTFGLFLIVVNVIILMTVDYLLDGFGIDGFFWAIIFSVLVSIVNSILYDLSK
jgi:putative membrane protein